MSNESREYSSDPERLNQKNENIGLKVRLAIGKNAFVPTARIRGNLEALHPITDFGAFNVASTMERVDYWVNKKDVPKDQRMVRWKHGVTNFFNSNVAQEHAEFLGKFLIQTGLGDGIDEFNEQTAEKLYNRYFRNQANVSNIGLFVHDVLRTNEVDTTINNIENDAYQRVQQNLQIVQRLTVIFGEKSAEITAALIDLQTTLRNPEQKQQFVQKAQENNLWRVNEGLTDKEKQLLVYLHLHHHIARTHRRQAIQAATGAAVAASQTPGEAFQGEGGGDSSRFRKDEDMDEDQENEYGAFGYGAQQAVGGREEDEDEDEDISVDVPDLTPEVDTQFLDVDIGPEARDVAASLVEAAREGRADISVSDALEIQAEVGFGGDPDAVNIDTTQEEQTAIEALEDTENDASLEQATDQAQEAIGAEDVDDFDTNGEGESDGYGDNDGDNGGDSDGGDGE